MKHIKKFRLVESAEWEEGKFSYRDDVPVDILTKLSKSDNQDILTAVAAHPNTPEEVLIDLSNNPNYVVRAWTASNQNLPYDILEKFTSDESDLIRAMAAGQSRLSPEILDRLSKDPKAMVRSRVLGNPSITPEIAANYDNEEDTSVKIEMAMCSKISITILRKLMKDPDSEVRRIAKRFIEFRPEKDDILDGWLGEF